MAPCACCVNLYVCMYNVSILRVFPYFYHCINLLVFSCLFCFCFLKTTLIQLAIDREQFRRMLIFRRLSQLGMGQASHTLVPKFDACRRSDTCLYKYPVNVTCRDRFSCSIALLFVPSMHLCVQGLQIKAFSWLGLEMFMIFMPLGLVCSFVLCMCVRSLCLGFGVPMFIRFKESSISWHSPATGCLSERLSIRLLQNTRRSNDIAILQLQSPWHGHGHGPNIP